MDSDRLPRKLAAILYTDIGQVEKVLTNLL